MRTANRRVSRADCNNCTCSPGLMSRTNKRSSIVAKRINIKRNLSGSNSPNGGSRKGSVFTIDAASLCLPDVKETNTLQRLEALRGAMAAKDVAVYIVPSEDQHQSEYVSPLDQRRSFISGFSGSAGTCIVTRDISSLNETPEGLAALSTDGRYFSQANDELDFNWTLLKQGAKDMPTWEQWTVQQAVQLSLDSGKKVNIGADPKLISFLVYEKLASVIRDELREKPAAQVELVPVKENLVDQIWPQFEDVPAASDSIIKTLDVKFAGEDAASKIKRVASIVEKNNTHGLIVSALDEIAWLLNLRGSDIQYNPVFYSYLLLTSSGDVTLFADNSKFDSNVTKHLQSCKVTVKPYDAFWTELTSLDRDFSLNKKSFLLDTSTASWEIVRLLTSKYQLLSPSPIEDLKAVKNETELKGAHIAHLKDGRALVKFFAWLEDQIITKLELIDEVEADDQLTRFRLLEDNFVGLSFDTISATGSNGAIIHYKPVKGYCKTIDPSKLYLNDSGSQFFEGTTDTTRTLHFGTPTATEIKHYTLVLKGHVSLGKLKFPENTTGSLIDSVARQYLWDNGLDYGHGTAHGVGSFLNVHEGPIGIGPRPTAAKNALKPGHLISNEPGYYEEGEYGIRIENVMYVKDGDLLYNGKKFLEFETVTRVPYCRKLINVGMLSVEEKEWINKYHKTIWDEMSPSLDTNSLEFKWLKRETRPL